MKKNNEKYIPTEAEIYEALCARHTKENQEKLRSGRVAVAGLGGLGSAIAVALARCGVGRLHLIDFDKVELSNLNRQQYRICDLGRFKTDALRDLLLEINPYLTIVTNNIRLDESNLKDIFLEDQIICEAFDSPEAKALLVDSIFSDESSDKILVSGSGMAGYGSSNTMKTRKINERFYLCGDGVSEIQEHVSLMAPRVGICANQEANMVVRLLLGEHTA